MSSFRVGNTVTTTTDTRLNHGCEGPGRPGQRQAVTRIFNHNPNERYGTLHHRNRMCSRRRWSIRTRVEKVTACALAGTMYIHLFSRALQESTCLKATKAWQTPCHGVLTHYTEHCWVDQFVPSLSILNMSKYSSAQFSTKVQ
jgi:hypothetical protein